MFMMALGLCWMFGMLFASGFVLEHVDNQKENAHYEQEYNNF